MALCSVTAASVNIRAEAQGFDIDYETVAYSGKHGLMKYSKTPFKNLFNSAKLPAKVVNAVLKDADKLYVGTDSGLVLIDSKNNRTIENDATKLLKEDRIRNIYKDSKGNIWISTYGQNGLVRIAVNGKPECISSKYEELSGMKFRSVTELSDGRILIASNMGLNTTFTANSWNIMEGGYLCLCCTDGLRIISADNYGTDRGEYQLHLKSIEADGKALDQTDGKWVIPSKTRRIVLNISVNNFSLSNPRIHYYLDGSKDDGITCYQNEITPLAFTNLAYGKYDLHVCVIDDLTGEVINEKVIPIEKEAAMYEYWYFKLYVMFVMMQLMMYVIFVMLSFKRRNQRIADTFKKYVAPQVVEEITKNGAKDISLSSDSRDAAVLFVDIRGFTTMSEKLPPEQVVEILNSYFELTTNAIFNNGGTLDKFIGDATMAVFNAPFDLDDYVYKALMTAVEIVNGGAELEKKFFETYDLSVGFGVGINCGNAVVGNIGCSIRMDYTAIGDTVNTAARLESKAQKGQILISQNVYDRVKDRVEVESIGDLSLKGKSKDVHVYLLKELK